MKRLENSGSFPIGSTMPDFELRSVGGAAIGSAYIQDGPGSLVIFTCNHCPYVKGSEQMLISIVRPFLEMGLRVVAICSNDSAQYPEDGFEQMKEKARSLQIPYPYLHDESQEVAKLFDAECTPECYVFDSTHHLVYHGAFTDNPRDSSVARTDFLTPVLTAVLNGSTPDESFHHPIGCSIKWR